MPQVVLLFSGKRKTGKDFITDKLKSILNDKCVVIKISSPIKSYFAKIKQLNFDELMSDGLYKETYRKEMIEWSEEERKKDPGIFCKAAVDCVGKDSPVWIVSDIRRKTDITWFKETFGDKVVLIRLETDEQNRKSRGWEFTLGVDDVASECDLDDFYDWDLVLGNNRETDLEPILQCITAKIPQELLTNV